MLWAFGEVCWGDAKSCNAAGVTSIGLTGLVLSIYSGGVIAVIMFATGARNGSISVTSSESVRSYGASYSNIRTNKLVRISLFVPLSNVQI